MESFKASTNARISIKTGMISSLPIHIKKVNTILMASGNPGPITPRLSPTLPCVEMISKSD